MRGAGSERRAPRTLQGQRPVPSCRPSLFFPRSCSILPQNREKKIKRQTNDSTKELGLRKKRVFNEIGYF